MRSEAKRSVAAFAGITFIMVLGNTMLFPVFPEMRDALGLSSAQLAYLVLGISVPSALFAPLGGMLADRFGRRVIIFPSLGAYGLGGLGVGLAALSLSDPFPWMLAGRVVQGIGSGAPMHLTMALVGDMFQSKERTKALGIVESANALGKMTSPLIGAVVGAIGWYAPFFVYPVASAGAIVALWLFTREPASTMTPRSWDRYRGVLFHALERRHVLIAFTSAFLLMFVLMGVLFWVADVLPGVRSMSRLERGIVLALPLLSSALVALLAQVISDGVGVLRALLLGMIGVGLTLFLLPWAAGGAWLYPMLAFFGAALGVALPELNTLATSSAPGEYRGAMTAIYGAVRSVGAATAPAAFVALRALSPALPFYLTAILTLLAGAASLWIRESEALPAKLRPGSRKYG